MPVVTLAAVAANAFEFPQDSPPTASSITQNSDTSSYLALPINPCEGACLTPRDAIEDAANAAPEIGKLGEFEFKVLAVGTDGKRWFINSQKDYRDQRSLTIAVTEKQAAAFADLFGGVKLADALIDRQIIVRGKPERVRVYFLTGGIPTDKYYYQTHIILNGIEAISRPAPTPSS